MMLNSKAALCVCVLFIAGFCYLLDQVALPVTEVTPPMLVYRAVPTDVDVAVQPALPDPIPERLPIGVTPKFVRGSPFESQTLSQHKSNDRIATVAVPSVTPATPSLSMYDQLTSRENPSADLEPKLDWPRPLMALEPVRAADNHTEAQTEHDPPSKSKPALRYYKICKGDTLIKIARREWNSDEKHLVQLLLNANPHLRDRPNVLFIGEELLIPEPAAVARPHWYTIQKSDSLASIARRFLKNAERWREIADMNNLSEPNKIIPGMRIRLPVMLAAVQG